MEQMRRRALERLKRCPRMGWVSPSPLTSHELRDPQSGRVIKLSVKRDGLLHGPSDALYGGNKLRKLDLSLPPLLQAQPKALYTVGGEGSHHALATSFAARALGLESHLALSAQVHSAHSAEVFALSRALATSVTLLSAHDEASFHRELSAWRARQEGAWLPTGGSSVEAVLGMVEGALELSEQLSCLDPPEPERIYIATASGSSLAGLLLGLSIAWAGRGGAPFVIGVRVAPSRLINGRKVRRLYRAAAARLDWGEPPPAFKLDDSQLGAGYGHPSPMDLALDQLSEGLGVPLDQSYTAKALGALLCAERRELSGASLLWHSLDERAPKLISPLV